jgi:putative heme iron utilization protein
MDNGTATLLARLIRGQRIAALGTLRQGAPLVSMVLYLPSPNFSALYLHVSGLAWHTQDMLSDPRVSLSIVETDDPANPAVDPQRLARVSVRGEALPLGDDAPIYQELKAAWLTRFPESEVSFDLADFAFFRVTPRDARFVAGFGSIHNLSAEALVCASGDVSK